jgi:hypothetical protein
VPEGEFSRAYRLDRGMTVSAAFATIVTAKKDTSESIIFFIGESRIWKRFYHFLAVVFVLSMIEFSGTSLNFAPAISTGMY